MVMDGGCDPSSAVITNMLISRGFKVLLIDDISKIERVDGCPFKLREQMLADEEKNKLRELRKIATPFWQIRNNKN